MAGELVRADERMDGTKYRAILEENWLEAAKDSRPEWCFPFQQHNGQDVLEWSGQSPDLYPIQNLLVDFNVAVHLNIRTLFNLTKVPLCCKEEKPKKLEFRSENFAEGI